MKPQDIEKRSFEIITAELGERTFPDGIAQVVKRVIHTTADFDYADNLVFSPDVIEKAKAALLSGRDRRHRAPTWRFRASAADARHKSAAEALCLRPVRKSRRRRKRAA